MRTEEQTQNERMIFRKRNAEVGRKISATPGRSPMQLRSERWAKTLTSLD